MEFFKTKLFGDEVNVLFTGPNYFFFNGFYGLVCIAQRVFDEETEKNDADHWCEKFILYSGHCDGDIEKDAFAMARRVIEKYDQRYVAKEFKYEEKVVDLKKCFVDVTYDLNHFG